MLVTRTPETISGYKKNFDFRKLGNTKMEKTADDRLSGEQIEQNLRGIPGWSYDSANTRIEKTFVRKNFLDAVALIQQIAPIAEKQDHHPDLLLSDYKKVKVMLSTHSAGGITQNDFDLARSIDQLPG